MDVKERIEYLEERLETEVCLCEELDILLELDKLYKEEKVCHAVASNV